MNMFNVGEFVIATTDKYLITNQRTLCVVEEILHDDFIMVKNIATYYKPCVEDTKATFNVQAGLFRVCTLDEFKTLYDGEVFYNADFVIEEKKPQYDAVPVSSKVINRIVEQYYNWCDATGYNPSYDACYETITTNAERKLWVISQMRKSEYWDEDNMRIEIPATFHRDYNPQQIKKFGKYFCNRVMESIEEYTIDGMTYEYVTHRAEECRDVLRRMKDLQEMHIYSVNGSEYYEKEVVWDGLSMQDVKLVWNKYRKIIETFKISDEVKMLPNGKYVSNKLYNEYESVCRLFDFLSSSPEDYISAPECDFEGNILNDCVVKFFKNLPVDAVAGQKVTKPILKLAKHYGFTTGDLYDVYDGRGNFIGQRERWEKEYNDFCDSITPRDFNQTLYISVNVMDFLTASWGNTWTSCYNTDKKHIFGITGDYVNGCCSGGTLSYALDPSSVVAYTLKDDSKKCDYTEARKIERCIFSIAEGQICQSRMYPQSNDGNSFKYEQYRTNVQKIFADIWGISNMWKRTKVCNLDSIREVFDTSNFVGYFDYEHFSNLTSVSVHKDGDIVKPFKRIVVGKYPICPCCGEEHDEENAIECSDCYDESRRYTCDLCNCRYDEEDMYYINGEWYCSGCVSYCDYHGQYEAEGLTEVPGYGYVCDDAINYSGDFRTCDECGEIAYVYSDDCIDIEDHFFCCADCADDAGYHYVDAYEEYLHESAVTYCEECLTWVLNEDYNEEEDMCNNCAARASAEEELA